MNFHGQKPSVQGAGGAQLIVCCHSVAVLLVENPDSRGSATSVSELSSLGGLAAKHGQDDLHTYTNPSQMLGPRLGKLPESLSIPRLHAESSLKRRVYAGSLTPSGPAEGPSPSGQWLTYLRAVGGPPLVNFFVGRKTDARRWDVKLLGHQNLHLVVPFSSWRLLDGPVLVNFFVGKLSALVNFFVGRDHLTRKSHLFRLPVQLDKREGLSCQLFCGKGCLYCQLFCGRFCLSDGQKS